MREGTDGTCSKIIGGFDQGIVQFLNARVDGEDHEEKKVVNQSKHNREGHCRVERKHKEDEVKLGSWVTKQRSRKGGLAPDQIERLNSLGFFEKE